MSDKKTKTPPEVEENKQQSPDVVVEQEQSTLVKYRVNSKTGLNLRPEPSKLKPALRVLPYEAEVDVHGEPVVIGGVTWLRVENGWCDSAFLTKIGEEE